MKRRALMLAILLSTVVLFVVFPSLFRRERGMLTVAFLDVGQGDAVYIEAPNGNQLLYDAGKDGSVVRALREVMPLYDRSIDVLVPSHPDLDHVGGFPDILARFRARMILAASYAGVKESAEYEEMSRLAKENHVPWVFARTGERIMLDRNVAIDVLYPDANIRVGDSNVASTVLLLSYGSTTLLLSGDLPEETEEFLVSTYGMVLDVDMLKAGHHGSKTSTSNIFLEATTPDYVIISAGKNNRYGHPSRELLDRLEALNIPYIGTYDHGTIVLESDGIEWRVINAMRAHQITPTDR